LLAIAFETACQGCEMPVAKLIPNARNARNARTYSDEQVGQLAASMVGASDQVDHGCCSAFRLRVAGEMRLGRSSNQ
jgi:hypothetical protein